MTVPILSTQADALQQSFAVAACPERIDRAARSLATHAFSVEILHEAHAAHVRVASLLSDKATVYTAASETLRLSGIEPDINDSDGQPSAINKLLIINAEPFPGRTSVLLVREPIGF